MTGPEPNERFDRWVEQCREQLHSGGAAKALAVWLMDEGVDSQTAAAILRAAQNGVAAAAAAAPILQNGHVDPATAESSAPHTDVGAEGGPVAAAMPDPDPTSSPGQSAAKFAGAFGRPRPVDAPVAGQSPAEPLAPPATTPEAPAPKMAETQQIEPEQPAHTVAASGPAVATLEAPAPLAAGSGAPILNELSRPVAEPLPAVTQPAQQVAAPQIPPIPPIPPVPTISAPVRAPAVPSTLFGTPRPPVATAPAAAAVAGETEPEAPEAEASLPDLAADVPDNFADPVVDDIAPQADAFADLEVDGAETGEVLPDLEAAFGDDDETELPDLETAFGSDEETELPDPETAFGSDEETELPDLETAFGSDEEQGEPDLGSALGDDEEAEFEAEVEPFEFEDSLEDAAARMGESLRADPPQAPMSAREALSRTGGLAEPDEPEADLPPPASARKALSRTGGLEEPSEPAIDEAPPLSAREALARAGELDESPERADEAPRSAREALARTGALADSAEAKSESAPPMSAREALARAAADDPAENDPAGDPLEEAASQMGVELAAGQDAERGVEAGRKPRKRYLDLTADDHRRRPARPSPPPRPENGEISEDDELSQAVAELGISFRDDESASAADDLPDADTAKTAKELGISFREEGGSERSEAADLADAEAAKAAAELGISFRDGGSSSKKKKKTRDASRASRFLPIILVMVGGMIVVGTIIAAMPYILELMGK